MLERGDLDLKKQNYNHLPYGERRAYYRFVFPHSVLGKMEIFEVNMQKVNLGSAEILIEDISLGGLKIISPLKLPIHINMKFKFTFKLLYELFEVGGSIVWKNEGKAATFYYGIKYDLSIIDEKRLASVINKLTLLRRHHIKIPGTNFIYEPAHLYFYRTLL